MKLDMFLLADAATAAPEGQLFIHGGDDHWNEAGQHIGAEALADFIAGRGLLGSAKPAPAAGVGQRDDAGAQR